MTGAISDEVETQLFSICFVSNSLFRCLIANRDDTFYDG